MKSPLPERSPLTIRVSLPAPPSIVASFRPLFPTVARVILSLPEPRLILAPEMLEPLPLTTTVSSPLPVSRVPVIEPLPLTFTVSLPAPVSILFTATVLLPEIVITSLPVPVALYSFRLALTVIVAVLLAPVLTSR